MILIITNKDDFAVDYLICRLIERKIPYFRLNSDDLYHISYNVSITNSTIHRALILHGKCINLNDVKAVWYRRKICPGLSEEIHSSERNFIASELQHFVEGLVLNDNIKWVNPISAVEIAERKTYQLQIAHKSGFNIPDTVISNDSFELSSFCKVHNDKVICKPIYHGLYFDGNNRYAIYTEHISSSEITDCIVPTLLQVEVPKGNDIRVTIIGNDVYPVEIFSDGDLPLDWRGQNKNVRFRNCDIPNEVVEKCFVLMKKLTLEYGAFDFIRTSDNQWYFLEVNPTGEWAWLEIELNLPMRDSFVRLFNA